MMRNLNLKLTLRPQILLTMAIQGKQYCRVIVAGASEQPLILSIEQNSYFWPPSPPQETLDFFRYPTTR